MSGKNRMPVIVGAIILVVVVALGLALFVTSGDGDDDDPAATDVAGTDVAGTDGAVNSETPPVEVTGVPLPPYDAGSPTDQAIGLTAPVVEGQDYEGNPSSVGGSTGNPTMVVFLAHWCPHCNDEIPELIGLNLGGNLPDDLDVIGVSTAVREGEDHYPPSEWMVETGWPWPVLADSAESEALISYGGTGFPFTVMLDADGNVLGRKSGSASGEQILAWIDAVLA